jgi:hypothetical protein
MFRLPVNDREDRGSIEDDPVLGCVAALGK